MSLNIIFAGTTEFAVPVLEALVASKHTVIAVYTPPDRPAGRGLKQSISPVKQLALRHDLAIYQPPTLREPEAQQTLKALNADLMVVVAYGLLLPKEILEAPRYGCMNIHPSLLPRWRGAAPIPRAIEAGDAETGVTIMQLDEGLDSGPIWLQRAYPIKSDDTTQNLYNQFSPLSAGLLLEAIDLLMAGQQPVPQDEKHVIYANKLSKTEGLLDWTQSANVLERKIRAFNPWPVAYIDYQGFPLRIWEAEAVTEVEQKLPGIIVSCGEKGIDIATGNGILRILKVQPAGGTILAVADFLRGKGKDMLKLSHLN